MRRINSSILDSGEKLPLERPLQEALIIYLTRLAVYVIVVFAGLVLLGLVLVVARLPAMLLLLVIVTGILVALVYSRLKAQLAERPFPIFEVAAGILLGLIVAVAFSTLLPDAVQNTLVPTRDMSRFLPTSTPRPVVVLVTEVKSSPPTDTPTPLPTDIPTPTSTATPTQPPPTSTATITPTLESPTPTPTATPVPVVATNTPAPPAGAMTLLAPRGNDVSNGPTSFEWTWSGALPPELGFEVRVWREGEFPAGVHDAILDNREGRVERVGDNTYRLTVDITDAPGVQRQSGQYLWTVLLVRVSPEYQDLGSQAEPATFRFEGPGAGAAGG